MAAQLRYGGVMIEEPARWTKSPNKIVLYMFTPTGQRRDIEITHSELLGLIRDAATIALHWSKRTEQEVS